MSGLPKIQSYGSRIIVKKTKPISENGFIVPEDDKLITGTVKSVPYYSELDLAIEQTIKCEKVKAVKVHTDSDGNEYYSILEEDILCTINN